MNEIVSPEFKHWLEHSPEARAFILMRESKRLPFSLLAKLLSRALFRDPLLYFVRNYPGGIGIKIREIYYRKNSILWAME